MVTEGTPRVDDAGLRDTGPGDTGPGDAPSSTAAPRTGRRGLPEWLVVVLVGIGAAAAYVIPYLQHPLFYYVGDNPESFVPLWHHFGESLRAGVWPTMDPSGWYGGNYTADTAYALWNPVELVNYVIVSLFDDLASGAAFVMIEFMALLAMASYLLCREYGATRTISVVVGVAIPVTGFTLYYEAAGWPAGLMAFTWVAWFWWAARRHVRGQMSPILPFVLGVLGMLTGNPYATLGLMIVIFGIALELLLAKRIRQLVHLLVMSACVGISGILVFFPLLGVMKISSRQELAMILNDTFMVPDLGDLAGSSAPSYLPSITNWNNAVLENLPSTYFIWFAIPLLPWLRWTALRRPARPIASLAAIIGVYAFMVLGPSNFWLFRWPIRLVEYLYLGLGVLLAVLLSAGLATDRFRRRALATGGLVLLGAYLSFAVRPEFWRMHLAVAVAMAALSLGVVVAYRRGGWVAAGAVMMIGTIGVLTYQTNRIPVNGGGGVAVEPPRSVSRLEQGTAAYRGTVLQLANQSSVRTQDQDDGEMLFGNLSVAAGIEAINRYSGIGYAEFTTALCMDYKGVTCAGSFDALWKLVPQTGTTLIDALRVDTLVLQNKLFPQIVGKAPKPGWRLELRDEVRTVWVREQPSTLPGRVSYAQYGTEVLSSDSRYETETTRVRVSAQGGELIYARLAWPGYAATLDGRPIEIRDGTAGLLTVALPPGEHELRIEFQAPGLRLGFITLAGATGVVLLQSVLWWVGRRRRASADAPRQPADGHAEPAPDTIEPVLSHAGSHAGPHPENH